MALLIPSDYGYVILSVSSTWFLNTYHGLLTGKLRKKAGIQYPTCYASDEVAVKDTNAFKFNCAQRAHANYTETLTHATAAILFAGLRFPRTAAALGAGWTLARFVYAKGYTSSSGPKGRVAGGIAGSLIVLALTGLSIYNGVVLALGN